MENRRTDIKANEVFISWTGADRAVKNRIVEYLQKNNIACLESDHSCSGNFVQWSHEAVGACNVFLLVGSVNTFNSTYVPVEIAEFKKLENFKNRIVPVWLSAAAFDNEPWDINDYASGVILDEQGLTEDALEIILNKVISLNINYLERKYREASKSEFIKLIALSRMGALKDRDIDFSSLYINRTVCVTDEKGEALQEHKGSGIFFEEDDIFFIYGPAGCGKSQYVNQLRQNAPEDVVIIKLSCSGLLKDEDVFTAAFKEFGRICGNRYYYSEESFKSLLRNRRIMLVFDGMDEVPTLEQKRALVLKVEDFYKASKENTILVFTGRNTADADLVAISGKKVSKLLLKRLDESEIRRLSQNLFFCFGKGNDAEAFFVKVSDLDEEIRSNPLLLSQLAIIYEAKSEIPATAVGIYDAITEITFGQKVQTENIPAEYENMVTKDISNILKDFSKERYTLLSRGKNIAAKKILKKLIGQRDYKDNIEARAEFLWDYLNNRAIFIEGEFYHKMLLEYFTAVKYYEEAFDYYDELETVEIIDELFSHYNDPYWTAVIKMFLIKADSCIDEETTTDLYKYICTLGICEYTLLFDTCRDLLSHKEQAQMVLIADILKKSAEAVYPAYGPLFWYVPEYELYEICLLALQALSEEQSFAQMLSLVRDVCFIMGGKYTAEAVTRDIPAKSLFESAQAGLFGVRRALCELFYLGATAYEEGNNIYPRCFNVAEAKSFMENGCGVLGRMEDPFEDELGLFAHEAYSELNGEFIGIVACPYNIDEIEKRLVRCSKLTGLVLSPTQNTKMEYIAINKKHIRVIYIPENINEFQFNKSEDNRSWKNAMADRYAKAFAKVQNIVISDEIMDFRLNKYKSKHDWCENMPDQKTGVTIADDKLLYYSSRVCWPESIVAIPSKMFAFSNLLRSIFIPGSTEQIEECAFSDCTSLETIDISDGVAVIGESAFEGCTSLESINIPNSVTEVGDCAFRGCVSLKAINIPHSIEWISKEVFESCTSLEAIKIPDSVEEICTSAFGDCISLESIDIPDSVAVIGERAFEGCQALKSIRIPDGVTEIGECAFRYCKALEAIDIPNSVTEIDNGAFEACIALKSIRIPEDLEFICGYLFRRCTSLVDVNIPDSVTGICGYAFEGCTALKAINIPDSVEWIKESAFEGCSSLEAVEISARFIDDIPEIFGEIRPEIIKFRELQYEEASCDKNVSCGELIIPSGTVEISYAEYEGRKDIFSVTLPPTVKSIGERAFHSCRFMERINFSDGLNEIEEAAFEGCCSLRSVKLPDGLTEIGEYAFSNCTSLKDITIPAGVTEIGWYVFRGCTALKVINIPDSVIKIGGAFQGCTSLKDITIPDGVTEIGKYAFSNCTSLKDINIPDSVIKIGGAFQGCTSLKAINIPNGVTDISDAFERCTSLESINIPDGVTNIRGAFKGCTSLESINIPDGVTDISEAFQGCTSLKTINIPNSVIDISFAFVGCVSLEVINIPDGVRFMNYSAFENCTSLKTINIPDSVSNIDEYTFCGCSSLKSINIPDNVTEIGESAFGKCSSLESIRLPDGVTEIGRSVFSGCSSLKSINIPDNVTEIGESAFRGCSSLENISLPDGVRRISGGAFEDCAGLEAINIPVGVAEIPISAFKGCVSLHSVEIPPSVSRIADDAFEGCIKLTSIKISRRFEDDIDRIFGNVDKSIITYID